MIRHPFRNRMLLLLFFASLPTLAIYLAAKKLFPDVGGFSVFDSGWFLGAAFLVTAFFLLMSDMVSSRRFPSGKKFGIFHSVIMGIFQGFALIPGVSRSGSTILGGLVTGLDRKRAAAFSFMMSAPAIVGSLLLEGKDALDEGLFSMIDFPVAVIGIAVAAVFGFLALRFMLKIISTVPLSRFAVYLAVIGILYLFFQLAGAAFIPGFTTVAAAG